MNRYGSCRALLANSQAALVSAVELYNKPTLEYRTESSVILLVNAWELLFKAILSQKRISIYRPKERNKPYQSLSIWEAEERAGPFLPPWVPRTAVAKNLAVLVDIRNAAIHLYNQPGFGVLVTSLAQTCVVNYREALLHIFDIDVAWKFNLVLNPIGFGYDLDPSTYIEKVMSDSKASRELATVVSAIDSSLAALELEGTDTSCFMQWYRVRLESVKKMSQADFVVGVTGNVDDANAIVVERRMDPNDPNWIRQKDIIAEIDDLHGIRFTQHVFQALVWKLKIKEQSRFCWTATEGVLTKYARDVITHLHRLDRETIERAMQEYKAELASRRKSKRST